MNIRVALRAFLAAAVLALSAGAAQAQEYVKVDNAVREQLPAPQFVAAAYGFIWVAILTYVIIVARGLAKTRGDLEELKRRVERADGKGPGR
jgi:hypothetical protein